MKIHFDTRKGSVSEQTMAAAEKKLAKLDRFFNEDAVAEVKFSEVRGQTVVEVTVRSAHMYFRAEERSGDEYAAVDNAVEAIVRQIRKNKTRLEKRLRDGAFERSVGEAAAPEQEMVRRKRFELKPMTEEEATLQMELLNHQFYLFKNSDANNRICVVYGRENGGYGIIEAE
ncbi:MAG: ribosome-associated translation inhibitor RaiA [Clostridiales bacterium]|nr:MAG: ribosome-associated translation inhibitor RaiA [Clostridiales bacterium]